MTIRLSRGFFFFRSRFFVDFVSRDWRYFVRDKVKGIKS